MIYFYKIIILIYLKKYLYSIKKSVKGNIMAHGKAIVVWYICDIPFRNSFGIKSQVDFEPIGNL